MATSAEVLHDLLERRQWKKACIHLHSNQSDASVPAKSTSGVDLFPLHKACEAGAPHVVVRALLSAYADAAKVKGENGFLPLHYVCQNSHASDKVVSLLLGAYATAASTPDTQGMLPLHMVCKCGASVEVIDAILAAHPEGMHVQDSVYHYPLDYVKSSSMTNGAKVAVFKALDHASAHCNISKAATTRTTEMFESKIRKMESENATAVAKLKAQYEEERDKAFKLEDVLNKSDVQKERIKVDKLSAQMEEMKTSFETERADSRKDIKELEVHLEATRTDLGTRTADLEETGAKVGALLEIERTLNARVADLESEFESTMLRLQGASTARDHATNRVAVLEGSLRDSSAQNAVYEKQNAMLRDMLETMSTKLEALIAEHESTKEAMERRSRELHSIVVSHDTILERSGKQTVTMLNAKIDLDNIRKFVNMQQLDDDDDDASGDDEKEANHSISSSDDAQTAVTKSTTAASTSSSSSSSSNKVPARIEVPLQEKALGSIVIEELP